MIGNDENQEEVSFKVADRRKFNPDGSLREGVTLDSAVVSGPSTVVSEQAGGAQSPIGSEETSEPTTDNRQPATEASDRVSESAADDDQIPGAEDPASFVNFLSTLATNAAAALGAVPHPATGKRTLDLETGKYWLDVIAMVREKTKGNLHPQEGRLLDGLLGDLRMQYVQLVRATEEKLKAQAAQSFSGADILGKK